MTKTKGSKSVPTKKTPKTPAKGGAPEMTIDNGTTVALPNPADAPAPPKGGRKKKAAPTVPTPTDNVPEWARKAEAGPSLANATTTEPAPQPEAPAAPPTPKRGRAPKVKTATKSAPTTAAPGSLRAIGDGWLDSLRADGHTPATVSSYGNDLAIAYEHLGADTIAAEITEKQIAGFNTGKGVVKTRTGKAKAQPTILKTRRALRLALTWAEEMKLIKKAPYPAA